ncbi:MAG: LacI family transcriptional regulator [Propionibacteriaceae bacterium]|jgi:LacI family transcriptional regulator|nr:LacI family transcriptional regulator [Propionibacteriaceae bacterium]
MDVAVEAGVSLATASRVLNGSTRRVADSFRAPVLVAAAKLGYTANLSAQATARGTAMVIALLVADIADPYFGRLAAGVVRGADEVGMIVTISITEADPAREIRLIRELRGMRPHGLILAASRKGEMDAALEAELEAFSRGGGRIVALGPGVKDSRTVTIDNCGGALRLGHTLASLGYRRAIVLGAAKGVRSSDERLDGFTKGFCGDGGQVEAVYHGEYDRDSGYQMVAEAIKDGLEAGTLVFGASDVLAVGALAALREAGRSVEDIAVAGFGDSSVGRDVVPSLTTVGIPLEDVGYQLLRAAVDDQWQCEVPPHLDVVLRESTPRRI